MRIQNPRIRSYLGCIRLLEQALESNYAILHCSPRRLLAIWRDVRRVCRLMQAELAPTLSQTSHIPELETARRNAELGFQILLHTDHLRWVAGSLLDDVQQHLRQAFPIQDTGLSRSRFRWRFKGGSFHR